MSDPADSQRADVFLFRARFFKSRQLAAAFVEKGGVRLDRTGHVRRLGKASAGVCPGDKLLFSLRGRLVRVEVLALPERRGPAPEAQSTYILTQIAEET